MILNKKILLVIALYHHGVVYPITRKAEDLSPAFHMKTQFQTYAPNCSL